jgi:DNA-binding MarR family transcriptional regulator
MPARKIATAGASASPADAAGGQAPLETLLTYRVSVLAKMLDRRTVATLGDGYHLSIAEWRVLAQLSVRSPSTVRWLAARMRVDRAEVSRAAAALVARRLVRRHADPDDARSVLFTVTSGGAALYRRIMPKRLALHRKLLGILSPDEAEVFFAAVDKLVAQLDRDEHAAPTAGSRAPNVAAR